MLNVEKNDTSLTSEDKRFHNVGVATEKACVLGSTKCHSLIHETHNNCFLPNLLGRTVIVKEMQSVSFLTVCLVKNVVIYMFLKEVPKIPKRIIYFRRSH